MALTRPLTRVIFRRSPRKMGLWLMLLVTAVGLGGALFNSGHAQAATSSYVNFQARLQTAPGAIVPDGNYHIEFKIYNASSSSGSSQGSCTGDSACLWTETRTTGNLVTVKNGYLTVNLGSVTALPSIDWSQQLWLTMRVGGTGGSPSWDPEMSPRLQLTATPYSFASGKLQTTSGSFTSTLSIAAPTGGSQTFTIPDQGAAGSYTLLTTATAASGFIQNGTSPQTANYNITGNGTIGGNLTVSGTVNGNTFTGSTLTFSSASTSTINAAASQGLSLVGNGATTLSTTSGSLTLSAPATQTIFIGTTNNNTITLGTTTATSTITIGRSTNSNIINIGNANTATGNTQTIYIGNGAPAGTGNAAITIGNTANNSSVTANAGTGNINLNTVNTTGGTIVKSATSNSVAALQVQNASGNEILTVDTSGGQTTFGKASTVSGKLVLFNATNGNTATLQSGTTSSSYSLTLPTALGSSGDCLKDSNGAGLLAFGTCDVSAVTSVGPIAGASNANGATITGTTLNLTPADATNGGVLTNGTQSILGAKTFTTSLTSPTVNATTNIQTGSTIRLDSSGNLTNIGTYSGSGNITSSGGVLNIQGTGTNSLSGNLAVNGTSSLNNSYPVYSWTSAGGTDLNWKTIANVSLGTGTFVGATFEVNLSSFCSNGGCTGYDIRIIGAITRSGAVQDDTDSATLRGPYSVYVRVVKVNNSTYELQVNQAQNGNAVTFRSQFMSISGGTVTYVQSPANGTTTGTNYIASVSDTYYFSHILAQGNINVTNTNANALFIADNSSNPTLTVDTTTRTMYIDKVDSFATNYPVGAISRVSRTNALSSSAPYGTGSYTPTGTFTPLANTVLVANIGVLKDASGTPLNTAGTDITISGGGLTWVAITGKAAPSAVAPTYDVGTRSFYAIVGGSPPTGMQVTVDAGAFSIYRYNVAVDEYTNVDTTTPVAGAVAANRVSANNNTFTATLSATPTTDDYKISFATMDEDFTPTGFAVPSGWTQIYDIGPVQGGDGPESIVQQQTASTSTTLDFAISNNADQSPNATTVYGGFIMKHNTGTVSQGILQLGAGVTTDIIAKPTSTFQVQNSSGTALFSVNTLTGAVKVGNSLQGGVISLTQQVNTSSTITVTGAGVGYYLSADSGTTNSSLTTTFNITGLSDNEGTIAFLSIRANKGSTTGTRTHTVVVQINSSQVSQVQTNNGTSSTSAFTNIENYMVMRLNGAWRIIGSGPNNSDTADLAEWIKYTGVQPEPGELLTVGDDMVNGSVKKTTGAYDNKLIGVVTTSPALTFYNNNNRDSVPIALTGRVPVKVSTENGPIEAGDYLTASSVPGVAMKATKAGRMVGTALTSYSGEGDGSVIVQVQPGYAVPAFGASQLYTGDNGQGQTPQGAGNVQGSQLLGSRLDELNERVDTLSGNLQSLRSTVDDLGSSINTGSLQTSSLRATGSATVQGDLTVGGTTRLKGLELSDHLTTKGDAPKVELQPAAGTGDKAKVEITGNDITGVLTIFIGDDPLADNLLKLTFNKAYQVTPQVVLTPVGKGSAGLQPYVDQPTSKDFMVGVTNQPESGQSYKFNYQIMQ